MRKIRVEKKSFKILMSERCYRFKPDGIGAHAPADPGAYEFVTFNAKREARVVFVGHAIEATLRDTLGGHLLGSLEPRSSLLFEKYENVYFDYVARSDAESPEDWADIAAALKAKHRPELNAPDSLPPTGRFSEVALEEVEIWF